MPEILMFVGLLVFAGGGIWLYLSRRQTPAAARTTAAAPDQASVTESVSAGGEMRARLKYLRDLREELHVLLDLQEIAGRRLSFEDHWKEIEAKHLAHDPDPGDKNAYRSLTFWTEQFRDRCRRIQEMAKMKLGIDVDAIRRSGRVPVAPREVEIKSRRTRDSYRFVHWEKNVTERVIEMMNAKVAEIPVLEGLEGRKQ